jgi:hypothetical protein
MEGSEQQNGAGYNPLLESGRGTFLPTRASGSAVSQRRAWSYGNGYGVLRMSDARFDDTHLLLAAVLGPAKFI